MAGESTKVEKLAVFVIIEPAHDPAQKIWRRIGNAFKNRDGSISVYLDALPINGRLLLRTVGDMPADAKGEG